jgi:hypothetical protein
MQTPERLPNRRVSEIFSLRSEGLSYTATVSPFEDGRVAENFMSNHNAGSAADVGAREAAVCCSIALQFGADIETIRKDLCIDSHGRPSTPLDAALALIAERHK